MNNIKDIPVAILAGGLATRLRPLTLNIPKSLIPVAGKPFLFHQLKLLREQGIRRVVMCVGFLGEQIVNEFGDGKSLGIKIDYSFDGKTQLGTGGSLLQALPLLGDNFFVLYGDSYLTTSFAPIASFFENSGKAGLMTLYKNHDLYETNNVVFRDGKIIKYDKKAIVPEMLYIDYGLSMFKSTSLEKWSVGDVFDLATVIQALIQEDDLVGFEVKERFYEIGSPEGISQLEVRLGKHF